MAGSRIRFGTCAWSFDDWRGNFYPDHLPSNQWLAWHARYFSAVEIDATFYAAPAESTLANWLEATPEDFRFTCKMPREITHERRLRDAGDATRAFLAAMEPLQPKLGPVLIQLPPDFRPADDEAALRSFLMELPRDFSFAVEFRNDEWHLPRIAHFFEHEKICWVWTDTTTLRQQNRGAFAFLPQTAECLYLRLLGDIKGRFHPDGTRRHRYTGLAWPRDASLESWALKVQKHLETASCVYIFAGNHFEGFAPLTAQRLARHFDVALALPEVVAAEPVTVEDNQLELL